MRGEVRGLGVDGPVRSSEAITTARDSSPSRLAVGSAKGAPPYSFDCTRGIMWLPAGMSTSAAPERLARRRLLPKSME
jgi:hypothetical protein